MPGDQAKRGNEVKDEMRSVTIPVTALEESHGKVFVTLTYPKNLRDSEVMENVLGFAIHELHQHPEIMENVVKTRTDFHREHVTALMEVEIHKQDAELQLRLDEEKTKRLGIALSCFLVALSFVLIAFYPEGRENIVYAASAALFVCALGAFGYKRFWGKIEGIGEGKLSA